ncbi:diguanylate cyclase [Actinoplanes sp. NPDC049548]|uniref:diguanylate cyclase domain-containing protein n=1 Tax=Actinoplanes sp. NPDC049548 TaxID=3155152 RepID=UPI00343DB719
MGRRVSFTLGSALCCLAALALVAGVGLYLGNIQATARDAVHRAFADRNKLAADLAGDALTSSDANVRPEAERLYASPPSALNSTIKDAHPGIAWAVVLRADGSLVAADPPSMTAKAASLAADAGFTLAVKADRFALGDIAIEPAGTIAHAFQPFKGSDGPRVLIMPVPIEQVANVLSSTFDVTASHAYVVDGHGNIVASPGQETPGRPMSASALASAAGHARQGVVDGDYYVSNPLPGSAWHAIVATSEAKLLAPLKASERAAWQLFAAFAAAIALLVAIGVAAAIILFRLAHARAHDALTGLPSRALFLDRAEAVIGDQRRQPTGPTAALFIDLDGFKPINDTYGHAVGDALLKAVARRLLESMRPGDYVSRFGGDEFLVLCKGLRTESDAHAVAERVRQYIAEPFDIDGHQLHIGTSIGMALVDDYADDAVTLIHNADLAMYHAKRSGKGRIEHFTPDMATV